MLRCTTNNRLASNSASVPPFLSIWRVNSSYNSIIVSWSVFSISKTESHWEHGYGFDVGMTLVRYFRIFFLIVYVPIFFYLQSIMPISVLFSSCCFIEDLLKPCYKPTNHAWLTRNMYNFCFKNNPVILQTQKFGDFTFMEFMVWWVNPFQLPLTPQLPFLFPHYLQILTWFMNCQFIKCQS